MTTKQSMGAQLTKEPSNRIRARRRPSGVEVARPTAARWWTKKTTATKLRTSTALPKDGMKVSQREKTAKLLWLATFSLTPIRLSAAMGNTQNQLSQGRS